MLERLASPDQRGVETAAFKYSAFLSYSHHDSGWAKWLHAALEGTRIDKDLVGRETPVGPVPRTLRPIFRDRDDFAAGHSLTEQTLAALQAAKFLIVLCSPSAANSRYVDEEIRRFKAMGRAERVISVIVEGEPGDADRGCFPASLQFKVGPDGALTEEREEPIAADARPHGDGKEIACAKVVAGLLGVALDDIVQRAERARRRHARLRNSVIALLAALTLASSLGLAWARYELGRNEELLDRTLKRATGFVHSAVELSEQFHVPHTVSLGLLHQAEGLFQDMSELGRETPQLQHRKAVMLIEFARNYAILGDTQAREARASEAQRLLTALVAARPNDLSWQSDLAAADTELGNAFVSEGRLPDAITRYRAALAVRQHLADADLKNAAWQHDLATAYRKIGIVQATQSRVAEALDSYRTAVAILERLAATQPTDVAVKFDIAWDHYRIGDALRQRSKSAEAFVEFQVSLQLRQELVAIDPSNGKWQRALSWSHSRIGDVLLEQHKFAEALESYRIAFAIRDRLVATDRNNVVWQRDLMLAHSRIGDELQGQRSLAVALDNYQAAVAIAERLVGVDRSNATLQGDLANQRGKLGNIHIAQSDPAAALDDYRFSLALAERIAAADRTNAVRQCMVTTFHVRVGNVFLRLGESAHALDSYRTGMAIIQVVAGADEGNSALQGQLAFAEKKVGDALRALGKVAEAAESYRASAAILERLVAADGDDVFWQSEHTRVARKLERALDRGASDGQRRPAFRYRAFPCGVSATAFEP